jgi:hypothetical protein
MSGRGEPERDDAARVIVLPQRPQTLGEPPERPPAEVIEFPSAARHGDPPRRDGSTPPRLAV